MLGAATALIPTPSRAEAAPAAAPAIAVEAPVLDFGATDNGHVVEHTFLLRNAGGAPLAIFEVEPDCGCTTAEPSGATIPPGGAASLAVRFDLRGRTGPQEVEILVHSNDPERPTIALRLVGTAVAEVRIEPYGFSFRDLAVTSAVEQRVLVEAATAQEFRVTGAISSLPYLAVAVETVEAGELRIPITVFPRPTDKTTP
jgi:hypothetical protein